MTLYEPAPTDALAPAGLLMNWEVNSQRDLARALFTDATMRRQLRHLREVPLTIAGNQRAALDAIAPAPLLMSGDDFGETAVFETGGGVVLATASSGSNVVTVAAATASEADELAARVGEALGATGPPEDEVPVTFWTATPRGGRSARRSIKAPCWSEVSANYERETALEIGRLITSTVPSAGRLLLWHGAPGTGKTSALRALARVWRDWCSTHFVTDPDAFLGSGTAYLLDVLTTQSRPRSGDDDWKMVVLEDAGELLTADAHERTGQALSRLLNVTDGLLGQGMNVIVLVTTNEPVGRLHPAITRPGRCWKSIEFQPLGVVESNAWLAAHDSAETLTQPTTLAELYEVLRGRTPPVARPFGFT